MPKPNTPYDPQPERQDALGELARNGYQAVPGDHAARLQSLQDRLGLPAETAPPTEAIVRKLRPRRWLAIAAGFAILVVAGIVLMTYDSPSQQVAKLVDQPERAEPLKKVTNTADEVANFNDEKDVVDAAPTEGVSSPVAQLPQTEKRKASPQRSGLKEEVIVAKPPTMPTAPATTVPAPAPASGMVRPGNAPVAKALEEPPVAADMDDASAEETIVESEPTSETDLSNAAPKQSSFLMKRAPVEETRRITGEVLEPSGQPVIGATLTIEETGQQVVTDQNGEFAIELTTDAIVGDLTAPGYNTLMFDLTTGEEFRFFMPRVASSLPSAQLKGKSVGLRLIAPRAAPFPAFDAFVAEKSSNFSGQLVTVQFEVNRFGRPRQIVSGPGPQVREAVKLLKEWLKNSPDWPEAYQRKSWRYSVVMP